jgi:hypothetical protein
MEARAATWKTLLFPSHHLLTLVRRGNGGRKRLMMVALAAAAVVVAARPPASFAGEHRERPRRRASAAVAKNCCLDPASLILPPPDEAPPLPPPDESRAADRVRVFANPEALFSPDWIDVRVESASRVLELPRILLHRDPLIIIAVRDRANGSDDYDELLPQDYLNNLSDRFIMPEDDIPAAAQTPPLDSDSSGAASPPYDLMP